MEWISLLQTLGGIVGGFGIGTFTKSGRVKAKADAYKAMADGYEARIAALNTVNENLSRTEIEHSKRISELNRTVNDKVDRIRELTDRLYSSEQEVNRVQDMLNAANERITALTEERDHERLQKEYFRLWHCRRDDCPNGIPPRDRLKGQKFNEPE